MKKLVETVRNKGRQPLKFLIAGGTAAAIEYASFLVLHFMFGDAFVILANVVSFALGLIVSFTLNKYWVFKSGGSGAIEFTKYLILAGINLALSTLLIYILVDVLSVAAPVAKLVTMIAIAVWNFVLFKTIIFKPVNKSN